MKKIIISLLLSFIGYGCLAQNAYYDALTLKKFANIHKDGTLYLASGSYKTERQKNIDSLIINLKKSLSTTNNQDSVKSLKQSMKNLNNENILIDSLKRDTLFSILKLYFPNITKSDIALPADSLNKKLQNPFFKVDNGGLQDQKSFDFVGLLSSAGNLNVSTLADGLTKFLIKRAKQELFVSVIEKLKDPKRFPEFQILFPNTIKLMNSFDSWQYANVLNTLKEAFDKDLQQLMGDIPKLVTLTADPASSQSVKDRVAKITGFLNTTDGRVFMSELLIGNGFVTGQKIPDVIHTIAGTDYLTNPSFPPAMTNAINLFDILGYSLRSKEAGKNYVSSVQFQSLAGDNISRHIYFGLIYTQLKQRHVVLLGADIGDLISTDYRGTVNYLQSLISNVGGLQAATDSLSAAKAKGKKDLSTYWAAIFASANQFLTSATTINQIDSHLSFPPDFQAVIDKSSATIEIAHDIAVRNYSAAIVAVNGFIPDGAVSDDFRNFFVKYGSFAANIVTAQNSDDAESALESVALPVGSYSIKQHAICNISLNGYLGYGWDFNGSGTSSGIYAPIGFSFSTGLSSKGNAGAVTAFISLIDLGSMVSYRLNNDSLATLKQDVRLGSIFSPAVHVFYSIPGFPVSLGAGFRRTPKLFYSTSTDFKAVQPRNVFNLSILFDIPIFTIHNKTFK